MKNERILIADDQYVVREGVTSIIESFGKADGHSVVGEAASVAEVESLLENGLKPTVALVDGRFPSKGDGARAAEIIEELSPETVIIAFSSDPQDYGQDQWDKLSSPTELVRNLTNLKH